ncbi:hypothetical protein [Streptomyces sp. NPDC056291]|uniref:hypothetical protein n=1 Tax=Streptomyces sp. NPDC056291 TaxID=3345772 RepID=UPI0035E36574
MAITDADRQHAANMSGLDVDAVKGIAGETRDELVDNARTVAREMRKTQAAKDAEKREEMAAAKRRAEADVEIDPVKLAAAIAKRVRF